MSNSIVIYGLHAVAARLKQAPESIECLSVLSERKDKRLTDLIKLAKSQAQPVPIEYLSKQVLETLSGEVKHQGVIARCQPLPALTEADLPDFIEELEQPFLLILDEVQDPHNLGACLRTADAAGCDAVIVPKDRAASLTPSVRKVASGAAESVPFIQVTNLARTLKQLQGLGVWLYGACDEADDNLFETDLRGAVGIVMGAEGSGLRRLTKERCDTLVSIPMHGLVSSLNVSVATGICLFEVCRQRG